MKVLFSQWMRDLDFKTISEAGIPSIVLMENASRGAVAVIRNKFPVDHFPNVIILAGPGNNGGDGIAVGRALAQSGYDPLFLFMSNPEGLSGDALVNFKIIRNLELKYSEVSSSDELEKILGTFSCDNTLLIDAIFGIGLKRAIVEGIYFEVINVINKMEFKIVSIDVPSGLSDVIPPSKGICVEPDITTTFQTLKSALLFPDDRKRSGEVFVIDIGVPVKYLNDQKYFIEMSEPSSFSSLLKKRESGLHKGKTGHGLVVAGSDDKPGAAILSSVAVLKSGAGLSTCVVSSKNRDMIIRSYPEIMTVSEEAFEKTGSILNKVDCVLAGPGMGVNAQTEKLVEKIISQSIVPVVLDADALNVLGNRISILEREREYPLIITPHPRELSRISGKKVEEIVNDPVNMARDFSKKYRLYTVLKGHYSVISSPEGRIIINQTGNPGMATAGSGDVLAGMITGMISQFGKNFPIFTILQAAVFIHGLAGDIAASLKGESSMIASDILENIPDAFLSVNDFRSEFKFT